MRASSLFLALAPFVPLALGLPSCGGGGTIAAPVDPDPDPDPDPPIDPPSGASFPTFVEVTPAVGAFVPHLATPSYQSTGTAWGDYDRDGHVDLFVTNHRGANVLLHNQGDGTFVESPFSADVALPLKQCGGATFADLDNDGYLDLYVCCLGANVLFRNLGGAGFADVTALAGVGDPGMGMSASFGDYDRDGYLDLYVANWFCGSCGGDPLLGMADKLYRNNGDFTFTNVTALLGAGLTQGYGFVGGFVDYDNDGDPDLYLVNDKGGPINTPPNLPRNRNMLWRNDGPGSGAQSWIFTEVGQSAGADARIDGMGIAVADYDNDGDLDMAMTDNRPPTLLQNQGDGTFTNVAPAAGVTGNFSTFGLLFADLNNDRNADLFCASTNGPGLVYESRGDGTFEDRSVRSGLIAPGLAMGTSYCDYDQDGWLDIVVSEQGYGTRLFRNPGLVQPRRWFRARLEGAGAVNRDAVGARVYVRDSDGVVQMQEVMCGASLGSNHDLALHFGLGMADLVEVRVRWPDGVEESFTGLPHGQEWRHRHPAGATAR